MGAQSGAIEGYILPDTIQTAVYAIAGNDTLSSYSENGSYLISAVPEGTYDILAVPGDTTFKSQTMMSVVVTIGNVTKTDTIRLQEK